MMRFIIFTVLLCMNMACEPQKGPKTVEKGPITLVIHGGAGPIVKENMTPDRERAYRDALKHALDTGYAVLAGGGKSLDAIIAAITFLEDSPLFNAGKGAVFTHEGKNELDASIMDGSSLMAGAVAGVTTIRNPILAARAVMLHSEHVMLARAGAEKFAEEQGLEMVDPSYFVDSARYQQFLNSREAAMKKTSLPGTATKKEKYGTVGAVALDQYGNIAAGTSTGGMSNKKYGRIGDSPVIGAGTYANNLTCAVSSTGWGEYFIRLSVAHDISAMMEYSGASLQAAADSVIMKKLAALGGTGGVIALDRQGNIAMPFNTDGMYRGYIQKGGEAKVFMYGPASHVE